jgi:sigma-B regulation protein RsbU (phosphoserine phosphatase)
MIQDIQAGQSGVRRMGYRGKDTLWAYGRVSTGGVLPVLIVRYERVMELAAVIEDQLMGQSTLWWQLGGIVLMVVFVAMIVLGVMRAKAITQPIVALTQASDRLAAGDYSTRIQIETGDELQTLGEAFNDIGPHLQDRERMKRSLEIAGAIQQNLLPKANPEMEHFDIAATCVYCDQTGGDYYDFIPLEGQAGGQLGIAVGDVTGHGIGAALLMAAVRGVFRQGAREYGDRLQALFSHCNDQLAQDSDDDKFITLFYGILNSQDRSMVWASGGHDPALWYHRQTDCFEELPNTGPPVGLFKGMAFGQLGPVRLGTGDILLVGTDGIWEAQNAGDEMFGRHRLKELIRTHRDKDAQSLCVCITEAVLDYVAPQSPDDDVTLVVIKID